MRYGLPFVRVSGLALNKYSMRYRHLDTWFIAI
jgi:hypothetical protein